MEAHLGTMDEMMDELMELGENIAEQFAVALYLSSLSESYSTLITALETRPERDLNRNLVKEKLIDESRRRKDCRKYPRWKKQQKHEKRHAAIENAVKQTENEEVFV